MLNNVFKTTLTKDRIKINGLDTDKLVYSLQSTFEIERLPVAIKREKLQSNHEECFIKIHRNGSLHKTHEMQPIFRTFNFSGGLCNRGLPSVCGVQWTRQLCSFCDTF